jgi:vitamin-K-epoxide reductase (warfarin-sensitive)
MTGERTNFERTTTAGTTFTRMTRLARRILSLIAILATAGAVVSSVSLYHHYGTSQTSYCDIGENFNCDIVNRSTYSTILGVPVALIGIVGYLGLMVLATLYRGKQDTPVMLSIASLAGLIFALYLSYIEGFVLAAWCILCLSSLAVIAGIAILSSVLWAYSAREKERRTDRSPNNP